MKTKIKEVQQYFKDKILNKDFEILTINDYTLDILVDKVYNFQLWIGNLNLGVCSLNQNNNFIHIDFDREEQYQLFNIFKPIVQKNKGDKEYNDMVEKYKQLKTTLKKLGYEDN